MNKFFTVLFTIFSIVGLSAQQLNCTVVINAEQTGRSNMPVFKTLEDAIESFVNETNWVEETWEIRERIDCNMYINITSFDGNNFVGTIQIQSSRPVFNSTYSTPIFNFNDEQLSFTYTEHQPLQFDRNSYSSNLVSVVAYYVYTIMGLDADTFELNGGTAYFNEASQIVSVAQQGRTSGWRPADGSRSRYRLNTDLLSNSYSGYREAMYYYHRLGMDKMAQNQEEAKQNIAVSLEKLNTMNKSRPNSLLLRVFFDAKAEEIEKVFSGGPAIPIKEVLDILNAMAPFYADNWQNIRM